MCELDHAASRPQAALDPGLLHDAAAEFLDRAVRRVEVGDAKAAEQRWLDERQELFERLRSVGLSSTEAQGLLEKPEEAQAILDRRRAEEQQQSAGDQEAGEEDGLEPDDEEDERRAQLSLVSSRDKDIDAAKQDDKRRQGRLDALSEDEKTAGDREGGEEEQKVCAICHNLFSETDTPVSTENGHCHRDCVQQEHLRGMIVQFRVTLNRLVRTKSLAQLALAELAPVIDHLKTGAKKTQRDRLTPSWLPLTPS